MCLYSRAGQLISKGGRMNQTKLEHVFAPCLFSLIVKSGQLYDKLILVIRVFFIIHIYVHL